MAKGSSLFLSNSRFYENYLINFFFVIPKPVCGTKLFSILYIHTKKFIYTCKSVRKAIIIIIIVTIYDYVNSCNCSCLLLRYFAPSNFCSFLFHFHFFFDLLHISMHILHVCCFIINMNI